LTFRANFAGVVFGAFYTKEIFVFLTLNQLALMEFHFIAWKSGLGLGLGPGLQL